MPSELDVRRICHRLLLIRRFEEFVLDLFAKGELNGTTHAYIGQEAVAVSLFEYLSGRDLCFSNHRCHAHYLLHQNQDVLGLLAELMGRENGVCAGIGGSQHIHRGRFYSNGVQGGIVPALLGLVWADRHRGEKEAIGTVFIGDGTLGQGQVYECLNLASLWQLPMLFVVEHNGYSQSTPSHLQLAGDVAARAQAFGIDSFSTDSNDVLECLPTIEKAVTTVRQGRKPAMLVCHTFRLCSHSKSDDARPDEVIAPWRDKDPLKFAKAYPQLSASHWEELEVQVRQQLQQAYQQAKQALPKSTWSLQPLALPGRVPSSDSAGASPRVMQLLNLGLHQALQDNPNVVMVGMDILDPYGGAFKIEKGLSNKFPQQVVPTPISETSMVGLCGGMALGGLRPVLQIMFGDFITLGTDPLVNYISKYRGMYNDQVRCPVVIRLATGGGRGYGPTHSQCLEKLFLGIPDLRVVALNAYTSACSLILSAIDDQAPILFLEHKLVYTQLFRDPSCGQLGHFRVRGPAAEEVHPYPTLVFSPNDFRYSDLTIATYGHQVELALAASERLMVEHEIAAEVVAFTLVYPPPLEELLQSLQRSCGRLVTMEEGIGGGGWGAEILAQVSERGHLRAGRRVSAQEQVIPAERALETQCLPSLSTLLTACHQVMRQ